MHVLKEKAFASESECPPDSNQNWSQVKKNAEVPGTIENGQYNETTREELEKLRSELQGSLVEIENLQKEKEMLCVELEKSREEKLASADETQKRQAASAELQDSYDEGHGERKWPSETNAVKSSYTSDWTVVEIDASTEQSGDLEGQGHVRSDFWEQESNPKMLNKSPVEATTHYQGSFPTQAEQLDLLRELVKQNRRVFDLQQVCSVDFTAQTGCTARLQHVRTSALFRFQTLSRVPQAFST